MHKARPRKTEKVLSKKMKVTWYCGGKGHAREIVNFYVATNNYNVAMFTL